MKLQTNINLDILGRPRIQISTGTGKEAMALIDTGADIPMWAGTYETLSKHFPNTILTEDYVSVRGINTASIYQLAKIPKLYIGDLVFRNVTVVIWNKTNEQFDMLLSSTMFNKCSLTIDYLRSCVVIQYNTDEMYTVLRDVGRGLNGYTEKRLVVL